MRAIENVALEWIETDMEDAEAKAVRIKALDPNGIMRRDIMRFVIRVYGSYLAIGAVLIIVIFFDLGDQEAAKLSFKALTELFVPITSLFGALATASFGINASNNWKDVRHTQANK